MFLTLFELSIIKNEKDKIGFFFFFFLNLVVNRRVKKLRDKKSIHLVYEKSEKDVKKKKSRLYNIFFSNSPIK